MHAAPQLLLAELVLQGAYPCSLLVLLLAPGGQLRGHTPPAQPPLYCRCWRRAPLVTHPTGTAGAAASSCTFCQYNCAPVGPRRFLAVQPYCCTAPPCTAGSVVEYKYVLLDHSGHHPVAWQQGNNSVLALRSQDDVVEVFDNW